VIVSTTVRPRARPCNINGNTSDNLEKGSR